MSNPRLDKQRDHGQISPPHHGASFVQDGHYFAGNGDFLFTDDPSNAGSSKKTAGDKTSAAKAKSPAKKDPTAEAAEDAAGIGITMDSIEKDGRSAPNNLQSPATDPNAVHVEEIETADGGNGDPKEAPAMGHKEKHPDGTTVDDKGNIMGKATKVEPADLDLAKWARGAQKAPFFQVRKAAAAQFPGTDTSNARAVKKTLIHEGLVNEDEVDLG